MAANTMLTAIIVGAVTNTGTANRNLWRLAAWNLSGCIWPKADMWRSAASAAWMIVSA